MELLSNDILVVLQYLLPGFIASWIFYGLTNYPKPSSFERIIFALILTLFIQALLVLLNLLLGFIGEIGFTLGTWSTDSELISSVIIALLLGVLISYLANSDLLHAFLRKIKITNETSYPTERYSAFAENDSYIVLHLIGERRLYGYPLEWPNSPNGHFIILDPRWLLDNKQTKLENVNNILIKASDVEMIEFMKTNEAQKEVINDQ